MSYITAAFLASQLFGAIEPAIGAPLKLDTKEARASVKTNKTGLSDAELRNHLREALREYFVVTKKNWTHGYSHVAEMDASGILDWPGSTESQKWGWMIRPGGLAIVTKPDGTIIYLARSK